MNIVKPLVWEETVVGTSCYQGWVSDAGLIVNNLAYQAYTFNGVDFASFEEASAAAFTKYEARILSVIDPTAIAADARRKALEEAAKVAGDAVIEVLLRNEPDATSLKRQLTRRTVARPILALINTAPAEE